MPTNYKPYTYGTATSIAELNEAFDQIGRARAVSVEGAEASVGSQGVNISIGEEGYWAKLTSTKVNEAGQCAHAWVEVQPDGEGGWENVPNGASGTTDTNPAFARDGSCDPVDTIVWLEWGRDSELIFDGCSCAPVSSSGASVCTDTQTCVKFLADYSCSSGVATATHKYLTWQEDGFKVYTDACGGEDYTTTTCVGYISALSVDDGEVIKTSKYLKFNTAGFMSVETCGATGEIVQCLPFIQEADCTAGQLTVEEKNLVWREDGFVVCDYGCGSEEDPCGCSVQSTDTLTLSKSSGTISGSVRTTRSVTSNASGVMLVNDLASPGASKYYGTDSSSVKGWHTLPSGSGSVGPDLTAIEAITSSGILVRTGTETWATRRIQAGNGITITDAYGIAGDPNVALASIGDSTVLANISGSTASPQAHTIDELLDDGVTSTAYALLYRDNTAHTGLAPNTGTTKNFLTMTGTGSGGATPVWGTIQAGDLPAISITEASQSQMEAATSSSVTVTPRRVNFHPGVAKAWIHFDMTTATVLSSHNITSITDNGAGNFTVTIDNDFSGTSYCISIGSEWDSSTAFYVAGVDGDTGLSAGSCRIVNAVVGGGLADSRHVFASFFGDQ